MNNTTQLTAEQLKSLEPLANYDLSVARRTGWMSIVQTRLGCLDVSYDRGSKVYTIAAEGRLLASGPARVARAFIVNAYDVRVVS